MSFPQFGEIVDETPSEEAGFGEVVEEPSRARSLISAPIKGAVKGFEGIKDFLDLPMDLILSKVYPKGLEARQKARQATKQVTEKVLPTQKGRDIEDILEFTGEQAPGLLVPGGLAGKLGMMAVGGVAKKGAKEMGLPEWAQDLTAGASQIGVGLARSMASKGIVGSAKQQAAIDFLKSEGFTDKQITPLIQNSKKLDWLSKGARKFKKNDPFVRGIKEKIGEAYENVRMIGQEGGYLEGEMLRKFEDNLYKTLDKIPRWHRKAIEPAIKDLLNEPITFTELHDFTKEINSLTKGKEGGKAVLGRLKETARSAQKEMNPELFKRLRNLDDTFGKFQNFADKMTRKDWHELIKLGQVGGTVAGILALNPATMKPALGFLATRETMRHLLTNPRLQNMHLKLWKSVLDKKIPNAIRLTQMIGRELKDYQEKNQPEEFGEEVNPDHIHNQNHEEAHDHL